MTPRDEKSGKRNGYASELHFPPRRRRQPVALDHKIRDFYSDEHPEIPKVRRASLALPPLEVDPEPEIPETSGHLPRVTAKMTRSTRPRPTYPDRESDEDGAQVRTRAIRPRIARPYVEDDEEELNEPRATNKILVSKRRTAAVYEPPPTSSPRTRRAYGSSGVRKYQSSRERRPVLSPLAFFQRSGQRQHLLHVCGIALVLVTFIFILTHIPTPVSLRFIGMGAPSNINGNTQNNAPARQTDPHQLVIVPPNTDHPPPPLLAQAGFLMDADTGVVLYAYNPFMHLPVLSTTKLMTALIAAEIGDPDQSITINDAMANDIAQLSADSSLMHIKKGETYTLKELLYGLMLVSGNDAAVVIADQLAGSQQKFVEMMNQRADELGLYDTHFMNPHGLLATGHYSSARDLAVLGKASLSEPLVYEISKTRQFTIPQSNKHPEHVMQNGDQFLWWYPGADGGKQGWDAASNFVQVVSCVRNNRHLIGAVIHTNNWWTDMRDLMNWGFDTYNWVSPRDASNSADIPFSDAWNHFASDKKETTIPTADKGRYYIYTGYSVADPVLSYFDGNGGLATFGYPKEQARPASTTHLSQRFEHGTIECDQQNGKWQCDNSPS